MARPLLLLVDDAPEIVRIVEHLARRSGQDLVSCGDATAAEEYLLGAAPRPDLLLLDVHLPGTSGLELYRRLLRKGGELARLPVALFTQWSVPAAIAQGIDDGIDFVAAKDILAQTDGWKERIDEILTLAAHPPVMDATAGGGREALARLLPGLQEALRHPSLRRLGEEVVQAFWRRSLRRALGEGAKVPEVDVWVSAAKLIETLVPLADSHAALAVHLSRALNYQAECLLGRRGSALFRAVLASKGTTG